jgi:hypothetical protein
LASALKETVLMVSLLKVWEQIVLLPIMGAAQRVLMKMFLRVLLEMALRAQGRSWHLL